ncbi:MAG: DNA alkylation repair protein [Chloroflexota bacterium]
MSSTNLAAANRTLIAAVRAALADLGDPSRALGMRAYLKSEMLCYGVRLPDQRRAYRALLKAHPPGTAEEWRDTILALWREADHREDRYAALYIAGDRAFQAYQTLDTIPMYEEMVITGAWWDTVDDVANHRLAHLLEKYPAQMKPLMLEWSACDNLWKRRSAIICQVTLKDRMDRDLLYRCIEPNLGRKDFFIRKAIGWALRALAWVDPAEVQRYVAEHADRLSSLSKREALINVSGERERRRAARKPAE